MTQQKSPTEVGQLKELQVEQIVPHLDQPIPKFGYVVVHRNPRSRGDRLVAIFEARAHAGAFIRGLKATNPDADEQFFLREVDYD